MYIYLDISQMVSPFLFSRSLSVGCQSKKKSCLRIENQKTTQNGSFPSFKAHLKGKLAPDWVNYLNFLIFTGFCWFIFMLINFVICPPKSLEMRFLLPSNTYFNHGSHITFSCWQICWIKVTIYLTATQFEDHFVQK